MHEKKRIGPQNDFSESALNKFGYVVTINRPAGAELAGLNRAEKYKILETNTTERRAEIMKWLEATGLSEEVFEFAPSTVFNQLFITCTPRVALQLERVESVVSVFRSPAFRVNLLSKADD